MPLLSPLPILKIWLVSQGLFTLWGISRWDPTPPHHWVCWSLPNFPVEIEEGNSLFLVQLTGLDPLARGFKDRRGRGFSSVEYTYAQGYTMFYAFPSVPNNPLIWKRIWNVKILLKMVLKYQHCEKIGGSTNSTFLSLILKEKDVVSFDNFRPISFGNIG